MSCEDMPIIDDQSAPNWSVSSASARSAVIVGPPKAAARCAVSSVAAANTVAVAGDGWLNSAGQSGPKYSVNSASAIPTGVLGAVIRTRETLRRFGSVEHVIVELSGESSHLRYDACDGCDWQRRIRRQRSE